MKNIVLHCVVLIASNLVGIASDTNNYPVIDIHTHFFNARYLPLKGIIESHGVPRFVASGLSKIIVEGTRASDFSSSSWKPKNLLSALSLLPEEKRLQFVGLDDQLDLGRDITRHTWNSIRALSGEERSALLQYTGLTNTWMEFDKLMDEPRRSNSEPDVDDEVVTRALLKASPLREETTTNDKSYLRLIRFLMNDETTIVHEYKKEFPEVDIMVHHMMDMEKAYNDKPRFPFTEQISRMKALGELFPGELITFVAFDPFRHGKALDYVKQGLKEGALGVKFYPPSGYRAAANQFPPMPSVGALKAQWESRYANWSEKDLDAINETLFAYCETNEIPIFTHCTHKGFEAFKGAGANCDPAFWEPVLARHCKLRLCFGHAGGDEGWFDGPPWAADSALFSKKVHDLCVKYENVYCEVAYLDPILGPDSTSFHSRLKDLLRAQTPAGGYPFSGKVMYGSDWHMIVALDDRKEYLRKFQELFADPDLGPDYSHRFFAKNAANFLRLSKYAASTTGPRQARLNEILSRL